MKIDKKEIDSVVTLSPQKRYEYFIKKTADTGKIWGLYDNGWALAADDKNQSLLPLWPTREYALLCAKDIWASYEPTEIDIHQFLDEYVEELSCNGIKVAIFYTPHNLGIVPSYGDLINDLNIELSKLE